MEDNFNDNYLDRRKWVSFPISGGKAEELNGRIEFHAPTNHAGGGIRTAEPQDISNLHIKAKLYSGGYVISCISIIPSTDPFYGPSYNTGYDIGIWELGGTKLFVYSGKDTVYRKRSLKANPENIEIFLDGDTIRFLEDGTEVYSETYKPPSKLCNIYLWGISWYVGVSGTSWADDFSTVKEAPASFSFASIASDKPSYDVGETVRIAFVAGNMGAGSGVFTVEFYDEDTGALLASFEGPLFVPPGGESNPFAVNIGAMPTEDWIIRCKITP